MENLKLNVVKSAHAAERARHRQLLEDWIKATDDKKRTFPGLNSPKWIGA